MTKDWRLERLEDQEFLYGVRFERKSYRAYRSGWEHDHCAGCWQKLVEAGSAEKDAIYEGYATTDEYIHGAEYVWVCASCFDAFGELMGWKGAAPQNSN